MVPPEQLGLTTLPLEIPQCADVGRASPPLAPPDTVASGLEVPWDLAFLPDGRILVTERPGRIRVVEPTTGLRSEPWATLDVASVAEAGLLGIDLVPDFATSGRVFVVGTYQDIPRGRVARLAAALVRRAAMVVGSDRGAVWHNRVVAFADRGGSGVAVDTVLARLPSGPVHAGGGLRFGPDGLLYLGLGEGGNPPLAQDRQSLRGKILRVQTDGSPPADNPQPGSALFAFGLRNVQGIAWDPVGGDMVAVDHGPSGLEREGYRAAQDELNRIVAGGNYGWPTVSGAWEGEGFTGPIAEWTPAIAPSAITFVDAPGSPWHGDAIVAGLMGNALYRVAFERAGGSGEVIGVACREPLFSRAFGRVRAVRVGPDGFVYFTTSNRDQRGVPRTGDDLLLRFPLQIPDA